jgi:hypothetical protein
MPGLNKVDSAGFKDRAGTDRAVATTGGAAASTLASVVSIGMAGARTTRARHCQDAVNAPSRP